MVKPWLARIDLARRLQKLEDDDATAGEILDDLRDRFDLEEYTDG